MTQPSINGPSTIHRSSALQYFLNLKIGTKLALGFGILVFLIFLSAVVSYLGSAQATDKINTTVDTREPVARTASQAQANLLRMEGDVRGYLALGDAEYRDHYHQMAEDFEANLKDLQNLSGGLDAQNKQRLQDLETNYQQWSQWPDRLFELRDDQLDREPAYRMLVITGTQYAGQVLIDVKSLIELQGTREPTAQNLEILEDMAKFQGNFSSMLSALRGYTTTRNRIYRGEYNVNLVDNQNTWEKMWKMRGSLNSSQQSMLDNIKANRESFLAIPDQIFGILESDRWREDLYLFKTEAVPLAANMRQSLDEMTRAQQNSLRTELSSGRLSLNSANQVILASGLVALVIGLVMAFLSRASIAMPIRRLTDVAEQIRGGDLEARAQSDTKDEIGILATTFNNMTSKLRQTLTQVRKEKKRADDLLEVVIPIGVDLTTEKDFNRLLEKMLVEAKNFCHADAGTLYLRTDQDCLDYVIVRNDSQNVSLGGSSENKADYPPLMLKDPQTGEPNHRFVATHVALTGASINLPEPQKVEEYENEYRRSSLLNGYFIHSMLTIPLKNSQDQVLGVMQLINARDTESNSYTAFDRNLQQMMESFSSLAVAALEAYIREQKLRVEIQQLRIEVDEAKRQKQVEEIVDTDFFQNISARAAELRNRRNPKGAES